MLDFARTAYFLACRSCQVSMISFNVYSTSWIVPANYSDKRGFNKLYVAGEACIKRTLNLHQSHVPNKTNWTGISTLRLIYSRISRLEMSPRKRSDRMELYASWLLSIRKKGCWAAKNLFFFSVHSEYIRDLMKIIECKENSFAFLDSKNSQRF